MNPSLIKEVRALWLPWLAGLALSLVALYGRQGELAVAATFGCAALLAAMSLGNEFHYRTLGLLLSQPRSRWSLWRQKLLVLAVLTGSLGLLLLASWRATGNAAAEYPDPVGAAIFLAVVCSAPFWTLASRSIIGGALFSLAGVFLLTATAQEALAKHFGRWFPEGIPEPVNRGVLLLAILLYAGGCLLAGWRVFARLELIDAALGESMLLSSPASGRARRWRWLQIRPEGSLANLARKELRLQRPVLVVAAVFALCWLVIVGLRALWGPLHYMDVDLGVLMLGVMVVYVPLILGLAASISLDEEKTLGLAAWQLTLPVSARRQWLVKLAVSAAVAFALGVALPLLLSWATIPDMRVGLRNTLAHGDVSDALLGLLATGTVFWLFFVLAFWAATLLGKAIRAVFTAVLAMGALVLCVQLADWLAVRIGGLETAILGDITVWRHLPPDFFNARQAGLWGPIAGGLVLSLVALVQSLAQFRRAQVQSAVAVKCAALLLAIAFAAAFWKADFQASTQNGAYSARLVDEVKSAVEAFSHSHREALPAAGIQVTEKDLAKVSPLSARARIWLRGIRLTLLPYPPELAPGTILMTGPRPFAIRDVVWSTLPDGRLVLMEFLARR